MTQGAFGAIELALALVADAGDEVVIPVARVVLLRADAARGEPGAGHGGARPDGLLARHRRDRAAITPRTRIVIVNSPSNPTGRVFPRETWRSSATVLERRSRTHGRRIWLLSDEPYRRIRFDGIGFASPVGSIPGR